MAAAYAALVSLSNDLELILNHPRHSFSFENKQIQSLLKIVAFLIEFMDSYDNAHGPGKEAAQLLERPIARAAHAAEEVIESHVVDQICAGSTLDGKSRSRFLLDVQKVIEDMEFVRRKAIKVTKVLKQPAIYSAAAATTASSSSSSSSTPLTSSDKTSMVGFDDVLIQLLDLLTGSPSSLGVIPIMGTGGIGKTTLTKSAFENPLIVEHFDIRVWATISQEFVVEDILLKLLSRQGKSTIGALKEELHKKLYGRRYLVVLDDMWSVDAWDQIKCCCPNTSNGSRVVVTTRQSNLGDCIGSSEKLAMSFLDEDKSWDLFCQKTFGEDRCPVELRDVGKKIVKKCKGLPLAIVVVAGHLSKSSKTEEYWESVANNMNSILNLEENKHVLDILSFSYSQLPARLKPCFIYMGIFPEDKRIFIPELIRFWIAEGFLKTCEAKDLEGIGEEYVKDLIDRNLIFPITSSNSRCVPGVIEYVGIHDVLRELCIKIAEKEKLYYVVHSPEAICREREGVYDAPPLVRSLKLKSECVVEQSFDLRFLRILRNFNSDVQQVNLRYFHYAGGNYVDCFQLLSSVWNLQSLITNAVPQFAPYEFWEMVQLRSLEVWCGIYLPEPLPSDNVDQVMRNLHTLWLVKNFKLSEEVLRRIPNIKELHLAYIDSNAEPLKSSSYYCLHNLGHFHKLESLRCSFLLDARYGLKSEWRESGLNLKLPSSLKKLCLIGSNLDWEEITRMAGSLPCLECLQLDYGSAIGSEWTLNEEKFRHLKSLRIDGSDDLVYWNADSSNFPVLECLAIWNMRKLDELPSGIGEIPTLGSIYLSGCSDGLMISAARIVMESQEEHGNEDLELHILCGTKREVERFKKKLEEESLTVNNLLLY